MAVKKRNPLFVIVASFITFGIYALYWFYSTTKELGEVNKSEVNPIVWTIALFIPFVNLYFLWKYSGEAEKLMNKKHSQLVLFIAWLVFFPIVQYLVQNELNAKAAA
ncbi:DUF4234 domain-containing protein [Candidatus Micrarchaeota archaeon]|nr:DUF4234 domain-containing protein [Candidatus Micrarchaeota archaeon]